MLRIVATEQAEQDALKLDLDAIVREGARRMLLTALKASTAASSAATSRFCCVRVPKR